MPVEQSSLDHSFQTLRKVRTMLLTLHKALLESEKDLYEKNFGSIASKGQFLQLVMEDPWFHWLRDISKFIIKIDESFSPKSTTFTLEEAQKLLEQTSLLLSPSENGTLREQKYYAAIQRDPNIAIMHVELLDLLRKPQ